MPTAALTVAPATLASVTGTRIAEVICEADRLPPEARLSIERKVRRLATGRQLQDGEQVGAASVAARGRDVWIFPVREVYRARLFMEFARHGVDVDHAERALSLATFSLGRHAESATSGLDAILDAVRATAETMVLEVVAHPIEGNIGTEARVGEPSPLWPGERSRVTINVGLIVRDLDSVLASGR